MDDIDLNKLKTKDGAKELREKLVARRNELYGQIELCNKALLMCDATDPPPPRYTSYGD